MFFSGASFSLGFASGFGTGLFARELTHASTLALRPALKVLIKSGLNVVDRSREAIARAGENFEDLVAEARAELTEGEVAGTGGPETEAAGEASAHGMEESMEHGAQRGDSRVAAGG